MASSVEAIVVNVPVAAVSLVELRLWAFVGVSIESGVGEEEAAAASSSGLAIRSPPSEPERLGSSLMPAGMTAALIDD